MDSGFQALTEEREVGHAGGRYVTSPDNMAPRVVASTILSRIRGPIW